MLSAAEDLEAAAGMLHRSVENLRAGVPVAPLGPPAETPPLTTISPALDIVHSRPSDPAHSEYGGVTKQLHLLLMNAILTPLAQRSYAEELRRFPFSPASITSGVSVALTLALAPAEPSIDIGVGLFSTRAVGVLFFSPFFSLDRTERAGGRMWISCVGW